MKDNTAKTSSKGYRLKPETHSLIKKMQGMMNASQEQVISKALKYYIRKNVSLNKITT